MSRNKRNTYKRFMVINGVLAFGIFAVVFLFLYLSFRFQRKADKAYTYEENYHIELAAADFSGDSLSLYLNDSLLYNHTIGTDDWSTTVRRFAESTVLMVVDHRTDQATSFSLAPDGSHISIGKKGTEIAIEEQAGQP